MEGYDREFWQFSDQLRLQTASFSGLSLGDSIWSPADNARGRNNGDPAALFSPSPLDGQINAKINTNNGNGGLQDGPGLIGSGKLAFGNTTTNKADRYNNVSLPQAASDAKPYGNLSGYGAAKTNNNNNANMNSNFALNKMMGGNYNSSNFNSGGNGEVKSYFNKSIGRPANNNSNNHYGGGKKGGALDGKKKHAKNEGGNNNNSNNHGAASEKRFKTLPASEALPRNEAIGGYIFVCNNDTMEENLKRQLFGTN